MAVTRIGTVDVAHALAELIETVDGVRVYWYVADTVRPPAAVISQPDLDFTDPASTFCAATWTFPVTLVTSRANDRDAQSTMSRLLLDVVSAVSADVPGIFAIEPVDARPVPVTVSGQDLPGYLLTIRIKA
jgi:hypothetical protein